MAEKKTRVPMVDKPAPSAAPASKKPPAVDRVAELEAENAKLRAENEELAQSLNALQRRHG